MYFFRALCTRSAGMLFRDFAPNWRTLITASRFYLKKSGTGLNKMTSLEYCSSSTGPTGHSEELSHSPCGSNDYKEIFIFRFKRGDFKPLENAVYTTHKGTSAEKRLEVLKDLQLLFEEWCPYKKKKMQVIAVLDKNGDYKTAHGMIVT